MTVLENVERLLRKGKERRGTSKSASIKVPEKEKQEDLSECFSIEQEDLSECFSIETPIRPPKTVSGEYEKSTSEDAGILNFQPEPHAPFEQEQTYDVDAFQKNDRTVEKILTPPPDLKKALTQIPQSLKEAFKEILNGELVGVWPIGSDCLRK